jgi:hypothetical protein
MFSIPEMHPPEEVDVDADVDARGSDEERVHAWRAEQLRRLGVADAVAEVFADAVDWHALAGLVERGCPPELALEIVR